MPDVHSSYLLHILSTLRPLEKKLTKMAERSRSWDEPLYNIRAIIQETEKARLLPDAAPPLPQDVLKVTGLDLDLDTK